MHLRSSSRERKRTPLSGRRILPERMSSFVSRKSSSIPFQRRIAYEPIDRRVALLERSVDIQREEQQKGLLLPVDVEVVTKQLNSARSLSKIIHEQADAGYLGLIRLLGLRSSAHVSLNSTLPEPPAPPDAAQLFHTMLARHPSLQVQLANINKAKQDYRLENFRLYPSVALHGSAARMSPILTMMLIDLIGGVTVNIPIWDFGAQLNTMRARRDTYARGTSSPGRCWQ